MTERVLGPTGSPRRRWTLLLPLVAVIALGLVYVTGAQAVHESSFQLDGDTTNTAYSVPTGANPLVDWDGIFNVSNNGTTQTVTNNSANVGSGKTFDDAKFVRDFQSGSPCSLSSTSTTFCSGDDTTYATGSKDILGVGNGGWQCNHDNNTNSKTDIMNAYILSYTDPATGDNIYYFGLDKNKDNGTNDVGFWFLQNTASCSKPTSGSGLNFTGQHAAGDTLVVSEFTAGGGVSTIKAFQWAANAQFPGDSGCIDSNGWPDPSTNAPGVVPAEKGCNQKPIASGADCKKTGGTDALCATSNASCTDANLACSLPFKGNVTTKWLTSDATLGVGTTVVPPDFFEGGINITKAFAGHTGTVPSCFNTVVPDTRSSASPTATLFDYTLNQIGECKSGLTTSKNAAATRPIEADGTITSGTDTANLKITGTSIWKGTLDFYLCGPNVSSCDTGGYLVTTQTVQNTDGTPDCGADCSYTSTAVDLTSAAGSGATAGQYCWHAKFTPDAASLAAGVKVAEDDGQNECFKITPLTPTLSTTASCVDSQGATADPCLVGNTIRDSASLGGTANNPDSANPGTNNSYPTIGGGTKPANSSISWTLYGPASDGSAQCTTAISNAPTPSSKLVSGDNTYGPVSYTSTAAGKYEFAASYPGDGPNTLAAANVGCDVTGANNEQVTVSGAASSSSAQRWLPNDRVVLGSTAGTILKGSLTVKLFSGAFGVTAGVCAPAQGATLIQTYTQAVDQTNAATKNAFIYNTNNSTYFVGTKDDGTPGGGNGDYFWLIQFAATGLTSPNDRCEKTSITITD